VSEPRTPLAPPSPPEGFWTGHPRYRSYVLFAATGVALWIAVLVLLAGVRALAQGVAAWEAYLAALASPPGVAAMVVLLVAASFMSLRWLRVGAKVATVDLGPFPGPGRGVVLVLHYSGLLLLTALALLVVGGVIL
jgi:fumarate reductase subunit C